jgi:hypothetical protein
MRLMGQSNRWRFSSARRASAVMGCKRGYGRALHRVLERAIKEPDNGPPRAARQSRQSELAKGAALYWSQTLTGYQGQRRWLVLPVTLAAQDDRAGPLCQLPQVHDPFLAPISQGIDEEFVHLRAHSPADL